VANPFDGSTNAGALRLQTYRSAAKLLTRDEVGELSGFRW
jgi:hypothetical protein